MPIVAIFWNIIFLLAAWETIGKARRMGPGELRFMTVRPRVAYLLMLIGAVVGIGMLLVSLQAIAMGDVAEICRRCVKQRFSRASSPVSYWLIIAALIELAAMGFFIVFLARNSLRAIRSGN